MCLSKVALCSTVIEDDAAGRLGLKELYPDNNYYNTNFWVEEDPDSRNSDDKSLILL